MKPGLLAGNAVAMSRESSRRRGREMRDINIQLRCRTDYGVTGALSSIGSGGRSLQFRPNRPNRLSDGNQDMLYVIEGYDGADVLALRGKARPAHLARLEALRDAGRLLLAGPC